MTDSVIELESVKRLSKDLKAAAKTLSHDEARYLVDTYYQMQGDRIRANNQIRSVQETTEPHGTLAWLSDSTALLERNIKNALDSYGDAHTVGLWSKTIVGIGPVISAGLIAHIDIRKTPTVGAIWRFAGLDASVKWETADKCAAWVKAQDHPLDDALVTRAATEWGRRTDTLLRYATTDKKTGEVRQLTAGRMAKALAHKPWNGSLKTLCWKIGESFVKVSGNDDDVYGHLYLKRKAYEIAKNDDGDYADQAAAKLDRFNIGKGTDAYKAYASGRLPPAHVHARAKRWAVKLFLAHWHAVAYRAHFGIEAPKPYVISQLHHAHEITCPNWPF